MNKWRAINKVLIWIWKVLIENPILSVLAQGKGFVYSVQVQFQDGFRIQVELCYWLEVGRVERRFLATSFFFVWVESLMECEGTRKFQAGKIHSVRLTKWTSCVLTRFKSKSRFRISVRVRVSVNVCELLNSLFMGRLVSFMIFRICWQDWWRDKESNLNN